MTPALLARIAKLIPMLGEQDAEALAAARAIKRALGGEGYDLHDFAQMMTLGGAMANRPGTSTNAEFAHGTVQPEPAYRGTSRARGYRSPDPAYTPAQAFHDFVSRNTRHTSAGLSDEELCRFARDHLEHLSAWEAQALDAAQLVLRRGVPLARKRREALHAIHRRLTEPTT